MLVSVLDKDRLDLSESDYILEIFPPKIIVEFERGSMRYHLLATKDDYDQLGLKKAANNRNKCRNKCQICNTFKLSFSKMWYHICCFEHGAESFEIKNALEQKEKESLEFQLGGRI